VSTPQCTHKINTDSEEDNEEDAVEQGVEESKAESKIVLGIRIMTRRRKRGAVSMIRKRRRTEQGRSH